MWITQFFSLIVLIIVTSQALPSKKLDDSSNIVVSINAHENTTNDHSRNADIGHPVVQSKPRILVSYGNVFKKTPVDPMQNLLMYFLMNVARDFAQDQDQFERRRSPNFFTDTKSTFTDVTGRIVNGSKKIGQSFGESLKSISSREIPVESQYEETHYYPHVDGTCMCFNRLVRQRPEADTYNEEVKRTVATDDIKGSLEISTEKKSKDDVMAVQLKRDKTELKTEEHNVSASKESSTIFAVEDGPIIKENTNIVRVLKVLDLDNLKTNKQPIETTTAQKQQISKNVIDLKTEPQENLNKRNLPVETSRPPLQPGSLELAKKESTPSDSKNKSSEDDGYYFLLSSGGTDKRTTASEINRELKPYDNLLPKYEDNLEHLMRIKRNRRRRSRRHMSSDDIHHKIEFLREKFRRRSIRRQQREKKALSTDGKFLPGSPNMLNSDISVLVLPNIFNSEKYHLRSGVSEAPQLEPASRQRLLLTITLPTMIGGGLILLGLCYFLRPKGWCCKLFMDKSNVVVVTVKEDNRQDNTTR